ncbi:MAG: hypothetical protein Q4D38_11640 [Planctomycetia bacterium]|nr:hypothetical protein [Planctomycetia bacterium]
MAQKRTQYDWQRTSAVLATLLNCHGAARVEIVPLDAFVPQFSQEEETPHEEEIITDPHEKRLIAKKLWS